MARTAPQPIGKLNEQKVYNNNCVSINYFRTSQRLLYNLLRPFYYPTVRTPYRTRLPARALYNEFAWVLLWTHIGGNVQGLFASLVMLHESDRVSSRVSSGPLGTRVSGLCRVYLAAGRSAASLAIKRGGAGRLLLSLVESFCMLQKRNCTLKVHVVPRTGLFWRADCEVCEQHQQEHNATQRHVQLWQDVLAQCSAEG